MAWDTLNSALDEGDTAAVNEVMTTFLAIARAQTFNPQSTLDYKAKIGSRVAVSYGDIWRARSEGVDPTPPALQRTQRLTALAIAPYGLEAPDTEAYAPATVATIGLLVAARNRYDLLVMPHSPRIDYSQIILEFPDEYTIAATTSANPPKSSGVLALCLADALDTARHSVVSHQWNDRLDRMPTRKRRTHLLEFCRTSLIKEVKGELMDERMTTVLNGVTQHVVDQANSWRRRNRMRLI